MYKIRRGLIRIELPIKNTSEISPWVYTIDRKQTEDHGIDGKITVNQQTFATKLPLLVTKMKRYDDPETKNNKLQVKLSEHSLEIESRIQNIQSQNEGSLTKNRFNLLSTFRKKHKLKESYRQYSQKFEKNHQMSQQLSKIDLMESPIKSINESRQASYSQRKGVNYEHAKKRSIYHFLNQVKKHPDIVDNYLMYHRLERRKQKQQ